MLSTVVCNFCYVYVIQDALDKRLKQQNMLRLLIKLARDLFENLGLLMSEGKEINIERSLTPISISMLLSNPNIDKDIQI